MGFLERAPPTYVSLVMRPAIHLEGVDRAARAAIEAVGLEISGWLFKTIRFAGDGVLGNPHFEHTMDCLASAGIVFGEDYKQGWAPADLMRELHARGRVRRPFTSIAWRGGGSGDWFLTVHAPP